MWPRILQIWRPGLPRRALALETLILIKTIHGARGIKYTAHSEGEGQGDCDMSQKMISRRGALSLLGLAAALGFAVPTTVLTPSDAEAQAQPAAPTPQAQPNAPTPTAPATSGMERRQQRRAARQSARETRREARRTGRQMRREARQTSRRLRREARQTSRRLRREARRGNGQLYMNAGGAAKQK
jgi:hypothetical protein